MPLPSRAPGAEPSGRLRARRGAAFAVGWFLPSVVWMLDFTVPGYGVVLLLWGGFRAGAALPPSLPENSTSPNAPTAMATSAMLKA